jgi:intracellular sulfur oxidation DsrE/DsrF family protein
LNDDRRATYAIYHGKKNDKIDMALANFLNKYPERSNLKIMFLRETEGVYFFGKKRVYIKIEKGKSLMVRVGGGYISIDEFID